MRILSFSSWIFRFFIDSEKANLYVSHVDRVQLQKSWWNIKYTILLETPGDWSQAAEEGAARPRPVTHSGPSTPKLCTPWGTQIERSIQKKIKLNIFLVVWHQNNYLDTTILSRYFFDSMDLKVFFLCLIFLRCPNNGLV